MWLSDSWGITIGTLGIIVANMLLISMRAFAWRTGLKVCWWSRSYTPEREHLQKLASSADRRIARRARRYLRLEILGWTTGILSILVFLWGVLNR
jgi:hypothetical protein